MWRTLLVLVVEMAAVFGADADNHWDQLREVFYAHRFNNGAVYEHEVALDRPPWTTWAPFYNDADFHAGVVAALQGLLSQPREAVEMQPAVKRAILMRDLWPAFDAQNETYLTKGNEAADRQSELRTLLAHVMRRLELSDEEVAQLPDNYQAAVDSKEFPADFNPESLEQGFLPPNLFDESGRWVAISRGKKTIGAEGHQQSNDNRSIMVPFISVSANRQETLDFLTQYREHPQAPPEGTMFALVRRTALPTVSGRIVETSILESLQLIVFDPQGDHHFKFVLDRAALISGRPGLRLLTMSDPVDAYSFEAGGLFPFDPKVDADGEQLVLGKFAGPAPASDVPSSLGHCIACHGTTMGIRLFANFGESSRTVPMSWSDQTRMIIARKEKSPYWQAYRAFRN